MNINPSRNRKVKLMSASTNTARTSPHPKGSTAVRPALAFFGSAIPAPPRTPSPTMLFFRAEGLLGRNGIALLAVLITLALGPALRSQAAESPYLQPAVPIAQRMEHRRTVLLLGDTLATEPLSGETGGTLKPDPLSGLEQRQAAIRVVDRRRSPDSPKLPPGIAPRSVGGVAGLRSRLFGELYDLRLGEVAVVFVQIP